MSTFPEPHKLEELLEDYSVKLEDLKSKFNPFFSKVSHDLMLEVDQLKNRIEPYANYHRNHQLKHLLESHSVQKEINEVHSELQKIDSAFKELERMVRFGENVE